MEKFLYNGIQYIIINNEKELKEKWNEKYPTLYDETLIFNGVLSLKKLPIFLCKKKCDEDSRYGIVYYIIDKKEFITILSFLKKDYQKSKKNIEKTLDKIK